MFPNYFMEEDTQLYRQGLQFVQVINWYQSDSRNRI